MLTNAAPNSALPTARELVSLTVPQLGMMLCHLAVSMTDLWVAGRLDASVQASLGIVSQVFTLLMLITSLAGSGCLTTISQALGAGLEQRARRYAALIAGLAGLTGTVIAATSLLCLPMTLRLMHVSPEMEPVFRTFIIAYSCQLPFYYTLIMLNSVFRAYKLVRLPLIAIAVVAVGNLIGSAGFGLGLCGLADYGYQIAWSTFGSAPLGLACNLYAIIRHGILTRASLAPWRWARRAMPYLFRVGGPSALGALAGHMGNLVILSLLTGLPGDMVPVLAGMTLGSRVESFLTFPTAALSMTVTILSGHLIGANRPKALFRFGQRLALPPPLRSIRRWAAVCVPGSGGGEVHTVRGRPAGRAVLTLQHSAQDLFNACERGFRRGGGHACLLQSQLCDHVGAPASAGVDARQRLRRDRHLRRHALRERGFGILVRTALRREKMA
ncbi:MAG: MATE family efflux transporter [Bilophila wadsworthia]